MTQLNWGLDQDADYSALAAHFRPIFAEIRAGAQAREQRRELLHKPLAALKALRFGALRLPKQEGGYGATLPQLFALLAELAAADSNVTQALRAHFGFVENLLASAESAKRQRWFPRLLRGDWIGNAWSETGEAKQGVFSTSLLPQGEDYLLNGEKFYTTGSLYADWIAVGASNQHHEWVSATVDRHHPGVEVIDDWNGFGQRLTASGTTRFYNVPVKAEEITKVDEAATSTDPAFYQLIHLATLAGIGRAAAEDVARLVRQRQRSYSHGNGSRAAQDPQILQVVGKVQSAAWAAAGLVLHSATALQYAADARGDKEKADAANQQAELAVAQAQTVIAELILQAVNEVFDALGASATAAEQGLDRYWRNARTLVSHNPRVYKARIVGELAVNGEAPLYQWRIGKA